MKGLVELFNLFEANRTILYENPKFCDVIIEFIVAMNPQAKSDQPIIITYDQSIPSDTIERLKQLLNKQGIEYSIDGRIITIIK